MARVTYGESITEYAGSIGGVTFLRNASGPIAKLRSRPPVNPSPYQSKYQTRMAKLVAYWPTLSQENKVLWDTFAAAHKHTTPWGKEKTLSGYQWFLSVNLYRLLLAQAILPSPPTWHTPAPPDQFTLVATSEYLRLEWDPAYDTTYTVLYYVSLPLRQSSLKLRRSLFYGYRFTPGAPISNYEITAKFEALTNVTWETFFASANCSIICRICAGIYTRGIYSSYTSAIVKIG